MSECCQGSVGCCAEDLRQALSIHTQKITDSCRDKDCIEDLRVYLTQSSQSVLDTCTSAKVRCADLLYTYIDVEPVAFDRNHYCIDLTFYYRILADATVGVNRPVALQGLAMFSKRVVLCGEDSRAHIYTSRTRLNGTDGLSRVSANHPTAVVEVLDPMVLSSKIREHGCHGTMAQIPTAIAELFEEELITGNMSRYLLVTLGQFSIVRLERDAQLLVPVLDYSIPTKECCETPGCGEDPCEMFSRIPFPESQFAPRGCDSCPTNPCDC
jgi:hypothetical protein